MQLLPYKNPPMETLYQNVLKQLLFFQRLNIEIKKLALPSLFQSLLIGQHPIFFSTGLLIKDTGQRVSAASIKE